MAAPTRVLSKQQRQKFNTLRKTQGAEAARSFRQGVAAKKGIALPTTPGGGGSGGAKAPVIENGINMTPTRGKNINKPRGQINSQIKYQTDTYIPMQQQANQWGQVNAYGSSRFETDPETGERTLVQNLSPEEEQKLRNQQAGDIGLGQTANSMLDPISQSFSKQFDWDSIAQAPGQEGLEAYRTEIEDKTYRRLARPVEERQAKEMDEFQQMAAERGWTPGSEVYNQQLDLLRGDQDQELNDLRLQAAETGGKEMERYYGVGSQIHQQQLDEALQKRYISLDEYNKLKSQIGGVQNPSFYRPSDINISEIDIPGVAQNYQKMKWEHQDRLRQIDAQIEIAQMQLDAAASMAEAEEAQAELDALQQKRDREDAYYTEQASQPVYSEE